MATNEPAKLVTLEVRRGNIAAQQLYRKFRFEIVGERKRYYQGKEDALLMTVTPLDRAYRLFLKQMQNALFGRLEQEQILVL